MLGEISSLLYTDFDYCLTDVRQNLVIATIDLTWNHCKPPQKTIFRLCKYLHRRGC